METQKVPKKKLWKLEVSPSVSFRSVSLDGAAYLVWMV